MTQETGNDTLKLWLELGELRRSLGIHIAALGAAYGIELPDSFRELLPADEGDSGDGDDLGSSPDKTA
jgi:hypothetical protein